MMNEAEVVCYFKSELNTLHLQIETIDLLLSAQNPRGKTSNTRPAKDRKRKFINSALALDTEGKHSGVGEKDNVHFTPS